ncbi:hypothetical protein EON64_08230 [archaeon]|nr:MAG: hypothetical protein EON64_08230 [archaeon]
MFASGENTYKVILFYRYVNIADPDELHDQLLGICTKLSLLGRILIAQEGINGTLGGSVLNVDAFISYIRADERFAHVDWKDSFGQGEVPFLSLSIRVVSEIISTGKEFKKVYTQNSYDESSFGGLGGTGQHLSATDFHVALQQPNTVVLDIRNDFEHEVGHFKDSLCIGAYTYAETFGKMENVLQPPDQEHRQVLMYCTGGIRCEKASAYLVRKGYKNVCQLEGGIHKYIQQYSKDGLFEGKNFVFDSRVSMAPDGGEAAGSEGGSSGDKVGKCIDCHSPYDVYSGKVVCTVCRMPVLVCVSCREHNECPEEYYCSRHR